MEGRGEFQARLGYGIRICVTKLKPKQSRKKRRGMRRKKRRRDETEERKSEQTFLFFLAKRHVCHVVVYHKILTSQEPYAQTSHLPALSTSQLYSLESTQTLILCYSYRKQVMTLCVFSPRKKED